MNSTLLLRHRADTAPPMIGRHGSGVDEAQAIKKKALERWENEGGRIPELALRSKATRSASTISDHSFGSPSHGG
jgi:hypothetical protein